MIAAGETKQLVLNDIPEHMDIRVPARAALTLFLPLHGDATPRYMTMILEGEGARGEIYGLFIGDADEKNTIEVNTIHAARATEGKVHIDAILSDSSQFVFKGNIHILPAGQKSNGELHQHSLLLSQDAHATAIPALEIEADDVKAFHAATAGPVDPLQRFFLMSRGFTEGEAEEYIVKGFATSVLRYMPDDVQSAMHAKLASLFSYYGR
ncbi:MAG: SufD family Fe-S cluster assembly protein [Patescibacteria group bacterium]|jgi:Fe-S cluster assembly protein SufD